MELELIEQDELLDGLMTLTGYNLACRTNCCKRRLKIQIRDRKLWQFILITKA